MWCPLALGHIQGNGIKGTGQEVNTQIPLWSHHYCINVWSPIFPISSSAAQWAQWHLFFWLHRGKTLKAAWVKVLWKIWGALFHVKVLPLSWGVNGRPGGGVGGWGWAVSKIGSGRATLSASLKPPPQLRQMTLSQGSARQFNGGSTGVPVCSSPVSVQLPFFPELWDSMRSL